jgi:hypothetical protein
MNKYQSFVTMEPYLTNPGKKLDWPSKDTLESERIQNKPPPWLTIGIGNRLSGGNYICKLVRIRHAVKQNTRYETKWRGTAN